MTNYYEQLKKEIPELNLQKLFELGFVDFVRVRNFLIKKDFEKKQRLEPRPSVESIFYDLALLYNLSESSIRNIIYYC